MSVVLNPDEQEVLAWVGEKKGRPYINQFSLTFIIYQLVSYELIYLSEFSINSANMSYYLTDKGQEYLSQSQFYRKVG